jgi:hypothetical protein
MVLDHGQISKTCKYQPLSISKMDGSLETQKLTVLHPSTQNMIRQEFKNVLIIVDVDSMNAAHTGQMPTTRDVSLKLLEELRKQLPHCNHGLHNALQLKAVHQFQPLMTLQMKLKHKQLNFLKQKVLLLKIGSMLQSLQNQMQKKQQQQQNIIQKEMLRKLQLDLMPWMIHKKLCLKQNILSG